MSARGHSRRHCHVRLLVRYRQYPTLPVESWNGALPPIGYRVVEAAEQRGHRTKKTLEIDPIQAETVRLIFRLAREGNGSSGPMGVKSIAKHLNESGIRTRDGGRWGVDAVHKVLTRTTYIGRHRFNTKYWKTRERKPEAEVVEITVPPIIEAIEFEAVQALLKARSPAMTAPRVVSGPTLLTGICFCAACGGAMTLRTGKSGRYGTTPAAPRLDRVGPVARAARFQWRNSTAW
jgi:site-specific DNA recombinase